MIKVKITGEPQARVFPTGQSTRLSEDGKNIEVLDKDSKPVDGGAIEQATISAIVLV